jgi:cytochrome bd-type quinol oxidase subunit 2
MRRPEINATRQSQVDRIVNQPTAEAKIDSFVREVYGPLQDNPIFDTMWLSIVALLMLALITMIGYKLYPKLVPKAGINIGLAATRYASYEKTFRLIVFGIILMGFVLPFIRARLF